MAGQEVASLFAKISADTSGLTRGLDEAGNKMQSMTSKVASVGKTLSLGVTLPLMGVAAASLKTAADFETNQNKMQAISGATGEQMDMLGQKALQLGKDTSFSAGEAMQGMLELSKAGVSVNETYDAMEGTLQLAAAAGVDVAKAAEIASNAMNTFGLKGEEIGKVSDLLAATANSSSVEISDVADSLKMAGAVFSAFQGPVVGAQQSLTDLSTAIGILGNMGIKGSDAGTSLKQMLLQLTGPSMQAKDAMRALYLSTQSATVAEADLTAVLSGTKDQRKAALSSMEQALGSTMAMGDIAYDASGKMRSLQEIIGLTAQATRGLTDEQRNQALTSIFGADATRAVISLMKEGETGWSKMAESVTKAGSAQLAAEANMKGLSGALEYFRGTLDTILISSGAPWLDMLNGMVRGSADLLAKVGELPEPVQKIGVALGAVAAVSGPLLIAVGSMANGVSALSALFASHTAAVLAHRAVTIASTVATGAWTAAQWLLNAALTANPVGLIIVGLAALTAGIVYAYQNSETFRNIVNGAFSMMQTVVMGSITTVGDALGWLGDTLATTWESVSSLTMTTWDGIADAVKGAINAIIGSINGLLSAWNNIRLSIPGFSVEVPYVGTVSWEGINLQPPTVPLIPQLAMGGSILQSGLALVGERGPELVSLPQGARVTPLALGDRTSQQQRNESMVTDQRTVTINIHGASAAGVLDRFVADPRTRQFLQPRGVW